MNATKELVAGVGRCEEASAMSHNFYIPCDAPATSIIGWPDGRNPDIRVCKPCEFHNIKNRGAKFIKPYDGPPPEKVEAPTASSPPAFMTQAAEAVLPVAEPKKETVNTDDLNFRSATLVKATGRLTEQADYLTKIADAVTKVLPGFIAENPMGECVDRFVALEGKVDAVETALKLVKAQISLAREVLFPQRMDEEQTKTHTSSESGIRMLRTARVLASIISGDEGTAPAFNWLREHELGALIKETVNSSSLCAAAKELMENGKELPDTLFNVHLKDGVSITKPKAK